MEGTPEFPGGQNAGVDSVGGDGTDSGVSHEEMARTVAENAVESMAGDTSEAGTAPEMAGDTSRKPITEQDINRLRSSYDKQIAERDKQLQLAFSQIQAMEKQLFEAQIADLPEAQQKAARQEFALEQEKAQLGLFLQALAQEMQAERAKLEPVAERIAFEQVSERYQVPKELLVSSWRHAKDSAQRRGIKLPPDALEGIAAGLKVTLAQQRQQARQQRGADTVEGAASSGAGKDELAKLRNSGKVYEYLKLKFG